MTSEAWEVLNDPDSKLNKVLLSEYFKDEKKSQQPDQIDADYLRMFALIHCGGKPADKAKVLYCLLQEGGLEAHEQISAGDKDLIPVFQKMCKFVTTDIFSLAKASGDVVDIYNEDECRGLVSDDCLEIVREDQWLESVYGAQSRLENSAWLERVQKDGKWIFDPKELRAKLFAQAGYTARH